MNEFLDCKNPIRSEAWMPAWNRERRPPSFITNMTLGQEFLEKKSEEFSVGMSLYAESFLLRVKTYLF